MVEQALKLQELDLSEESFNTLNRKQRRALMKSRKSTGKLQELHENQSTEKLKVIDQIVENEDDLTLMKSELHNYKNAQQSTRLSMILHDTLSECGASDETQRIVFLPSEDANPDLFSKLLKELNLHFVLKNQRKIEQTQYALLRIKRYRDEEELLAINSLKDIKGVTVRDLIIETLRTRQFNIDLIQMQVNELESQRKEEKLRANQKRRENEEAAKLAKLQRDQKPQEIIEVAQPMPHVRIEKPEVPFHLSEWQLDWTDHFWSDNANHLVPVPTNTKEETTAAIGSVGRGTISISPGSIMRALEFHLHDKDKIQRALSTRNKYVPEAMRRWVKLKRGKDRIGILIPNENVKHAIFFAGGRDKVYQSLN